MRLDGKVALITGGESGIGLATARLFPVRGRAAAPSGAPGGGHSRRLANELGGLGSAVDVTDEEAVRRAVAEGVERYGGYDVVFSNAGNSGEIKDVPEYPTDVFERVLDVHVLGAFLVTQAHDPASPATAAASSSRRAWRAESGFPD